MSKKTDAVKAKLHDMLLDLGFNYDDDKDTYKYLNDIKVDMRKTNVKIFRRLQTYEGSYKWFKATSKAVCHVTDKDIENLHNYLENIINKIHTYK